MALTALEIKSLSCPETRSQIKKSDGKGLFLLVKSNQSKLWRFKFKFAGKHQEMALGKYPTISLSKARELAEGARVLLAQGLNPMEERRAKKSAGSNTDHAFGAVALEWWGRQKDSWSEDHAVKVKRWVTQDVESIAEISVDKIDAGHIAELMLKIEESGNPKKAPPILSVINRIFGYALAKRLTRTNPAQGFPLGDIIKPLPPVRHHAAIIDREGLAKLIRDIDGNEKGAFCTAQALKLLPRLFLRPKEVRSLKWEYIDFDDRMIRIPAEIMKKRREHLVPLARQTYAQLEVQRQYTGYSTYVFPSQRDSAKPISKNVMTNLLRNLGYGADVMTAHGFRSTASTILHEQGWESEVIEAQLAHLLGTDTSRAYNRSIYLSERVRLMQHWADFLDSLLE